MNNKYKYQVRKRERFVKIEIRRIKDGFRMEIWLYKQILKYSNLKFNSEVLTCL